MTDSPRSHDAGEGSGADPGRRSLPDGAPPRAPGWVKVSAIIVGVVILLAVFAKVTGLGGEHGPGRHNGAGNSAPATVAALGAASGGALGENHVWTVAPR